MTRPFPTPRSSDLIVPTPQGPAQLPNHGWSHAFGVGGRFGILWKPVPAVGLGATYFTKVHMSNLKGYEDDLLAGLGGRSEEHTSELQSLMRISYAVFCLKKKKEKSIRIHTC